MLLTLRHELFQPLFVVEPQCPIFLRPGPVDPVEVIDIFRMEGCRCDGVPVDGCMR